MIEFLLDILTTIMAPQGWRNMSRPMVVLGVVLWGTIGALATLAGAASLAHFGPTLEPWLSWALLLLGLFLLGDAVFAAVKYLRAKPERS